ncbi:hypothetical protein [Flavobacterium foetidum]|uniref:hypothetical protein n=1 Tax=Flavobacterium foetidum TaxID=2026681 RepID=UPI001074FAF3|nr:hypothetical protein [Flavobacterium foetidum]KAF2513793.1 hypothetical protein E0W73_13275 [Flavobacterium foetidum]
MLIKSYGVTEQGIISEFGSLYPGKIALTAQLIVVEEELIDQGKTLSIFAEEDYSLAALSLLGMNSVAAQSDTFGGCIADAIGITAAFEVIESGIAGLGRKGVLKLVRKIGGKYLGAVGMVLAAYDFANCMGWLTQVDGPLPGNVSSCNDLVMIDRISTSFQATYYISKESISYKSQDDFKIDRHQLYKVYNVDFGSFQNPECNISYSNETVNGTHLDLLTVREINLY